MQYRVLYLFVILFCGFFQLYAQDTIRLNEVFIENGHKKPKLKKIKVGRYGYVHVSNDLFFNTTPFYLTDSLSEGYIRQIKLFFYPTAIKSELGYRDYKTFKVKKTEFEITLYEVGDNYSIGNKVNTDPILLALEESDNDRVKKVELDLAKYNFKARRFFIHLKKITETACEDCYYYAPVLYKTGDKYHYITEYRKEIYKKQQIDCYYCFGLQMEVKTLTQDY